MEYGESCVICTQEGYSAHFGVLCHVIGFSCVMCFREFMFTHKDGKMVLDQFAGVESISGVELRFPCVHKLLCCILTG